jgi:hypothetical protein
MSLLDFKTTSITNLFNLTGDLNIDQIRLIDWGKKFNWAVSFKEPKINDSRFEGGFFPASDISVIGATLDSYNFDMGQSTYAIPQRSTTRRLTMTFYDTKEHTLLAWLKTWIRIDILNNGQFLSCLKDSHPPVVQNDFTYPRVYPTRQVEVIKLDNDLTPLENTRAIYTVYPEGEIEDAGSSSSEFTTYTITFVIVGESDSMLQPAGKKGITDTARRAGRVVAQRLQGLI